MIVEDTTATGWVWPRCAVATTLTSAEIGVLTGLTDPVGPPPPDRAVCELAAGHEQMHAAFIIADAGGDRWWWIRWNRQGRQLGHLDTCDHTDRPSGDDCLLPATHPGRHSFQM
ncbi:hypothetical protein [Actinoplanes xinjiangensis]|uniref:hypothetical protein n=1 Tax=Actinoplanes xinjiangensis TaxID=512350 RepID=UPI00342C15A2